MVLFVLDLGGSGGEYGGDFGSLYDGGASVKHLFDESYIPSLCNEDPKSKLRLNPVDGMLERIDANPKCKRCKGHGLLDDGDGYGCVLVPCDKCFPEETKDAHYSSRK